jgi:hypothetical protein
MSGSLLVPPLSGRLQPTAVFHEIAVVCPWVNRIEVEGVDPCGGNVQSGKSKRGLMKQEFLKAVDFSGSDDVVHHGKQYAPHGVSKWDGFAELTAVDANGMHLIWVHIADMLDGVRGAVLAVLHRDFVQMTETSKNEGSGAFEVDFCVQPVHDFVAKTHRLHERFGDLGR